MLEPIRIWLVLFMVLIALLSPLLRTTLRSTILHRALPPLYSYNQTLSNLYIPFLNPINTNTLSLSSMASAIASSTPSEPPAINTTPTAEPTAEAALPKLSSADFRVYNRLAVMMDAYHNHFRHTWSILYKACTAGTRPAGMSIRSFLASGLQLCQHLTFHHTIEEQHVFPELAERMPIFAPQDHLIKQHEEIHEGLVKLEDFLRSCLHGERELRMQELKAVMDSFGDVLWTHLDLEVKMLGAENMRKFWSKEEMLSMNW